MAPPARDFAIIRGALSQRNLIGLAEAAITQGKVGVNRQIKALVDNLQSGVLPQEKVGEAMEVVARQAQKDMLRKYLQVRASRGGPDSYRKGAGRNAGGLERALKKPGIVTASTTGVHILNLSIINDSANHWARLNYGVKGPKNPGRAPANFPIKFDGQTVLGRFGTFAQSKKNFRVPEFKGGRRMIGYINPGGELHIGRIPGTSGETRGASVDGYRKVAGGYSRGVVPWNFVDAAFEAVQEHLWPELEKVLNESVEDSVRKAQSEAQREADEIKAEERAYRRQLRLRGYRR
jgi:hypothetical protein